MSTKYPDSRYPDRNAAADPLGLGFPCTCPPHLTIAHGNVVSSNRGWYFRWIGGGTISKVGLDVGASSGNISVAVYENSGFGRDAVPGVRLATTGAIACPAVGYAEVALGASIVVAPGDWVGISADNTTATFRLFASGFLDSNLAKGNCYRQDTAHPLPATPSGLVAATGRPFALVGLP